MKSMTYGYVDRYFDVKGVSMTERISQGQTVFNQHYCLQVLTTLGEDSDLNCGKTTLGFCVTTMRRLRMPCSVKQFLTKNARFIRHISLRVTFGYFQN